MEKHDINLEEIEVYLTDIQENWLSFSKKSNFSTFRFNPPMIMTQPDEMADNL